MLTMTRYLNYILHKISDPSYVYVQPEQCLPEQAKNKSQTHPLQRLALLSIPFLCQYKPFGRGIGLVMGGCRTVSHLSQSVDAGRKGQLSVCGTELALTALSVVSVASTVFHCRLGILATTGVDICQNLISLRQHYVAGKTDLLLDDALQLTSGSLYLAIMLTASLEITLLSIALQIALNAYQAHQEWSNENKPEAVAKFLMCLFRVYEGKQQWSLILRRNELLDDPLLKQLTLLIKQGKKVESLLSSPLSELKDKILEKAVVLEDAEGKKYKFGSHFHGFGKGLVKGANICFRQKTVDGKEILELDFKINHAFRDQLGEAISKLSSIASTNHLSEVLALNHSDIKGIEISKANYEIGGFKVAAHQINFTGIGSVLIGSDPKTVGMYNRVVVRVFQECNLFQLHEMLSFLQLEDALQIFNQEDLERLKLGLLFRIFCPKESTPFERTMQFFKLPISQLKDEISKRAPVFSEFFNRFYSRITPYETLPGRVRYGIEGLGKICEKLGAKALMSSIWIDPSRELEGLNRIASILKMGMLSTEMRFGNQLNIKGISSNADLKTGGSDSVFTQLIPSNCFKDAPAAQKLGYFSGIAFTFSLDVLDTGTYQSHDDSFGTREVSPESSIYENRPNIFDFVAREQQILNRYHEVMVKDLIHPSAITSLLVSDKVLLGKIANHLRSSGLVYKRSDGIEVINNIPLDQFLRTPSTG